MGRSPSCPCRSRGRHGSPPPGSFHCEHHAGNVKCQRGAGCTSEKSRGFVPGCRTRLDRPDILSVDGLSARATRSCRDEQIAALERQLRTPSSSQFAVQSARCKLRFADRNASDTVRQAQVCIGRPSAKRTRRGTGRSLIAGRASRLGKTVTRIIPFAHAGVSGRRQGRRLDRVSPLPAIARRCSSTGQRCPERGAAGDRQRSKKTADRGDRQVAGDPKRSRD